MIMCFILSVPARVCWASNTVRKKLNYRLTLHTSTVSQSAHLKSFLNSLQRPIAKKRIWELQNEFKAMKLVLGVDLLAYKKGVPRIFMAFEIILANKAQCSKVLC